MPGPEASEAGKRDTPAENALVAPYAVSNRVCVCVCV